MPRRWLRKIRVIFSDSELVVNPTIETDRQLKVEFEISKTISGEPNKMILRIYNLTSENRKKIGKEFTTVEVQAGYIPRAGLDLTGIIFVGQIEDSIHDRNDADIVTTIVVSDGGEALSKSTISQTFPAGAKVENIVEVLFSKFAENGIKKGEWIFPPNMQPYLRPYSISGDCSREMNTLSRSHNFYWSIQNGVMEIVPHNFYLPRESYVNKETGMIGYPQIVDKGAGVKVITLINPELRVNRHIVLESEFVPEANGKYRIGSIDYIGSNREGDFQMEMYCERIINKVVDEGKT